jgi:hypothetical protein
LELRDGKKDYGLLLFLYPLKVVVTGLMYNLVRKVCDGRRCGGRMNELEAHLK